MAKSRIRQKTTYEIELSEKEAKWLKSMVQNSLIANNETTWESEIRKSIWDALNNEDVELI